MIDQAAHKYDVCGRKFLLDADFRKPCQTSLVGASNTHSFGRSEMWKRIERQGRLERASSDAYATDFEQSCSLIVGLRFSTNLMTSQYQSNGTILL